MVGNLPDNWLKYERRKQKQRREYFMQGKMSMLASICVGSLVTGLYAQIPSPSATTVGERKIEMEVGAERVGKYEKVEFLINVDAIYNNPFAPGEVDLNVELKTPGGTTLTIPAFHYQHYEHRYVDKGGKKADWLYPVGKPVWKARFAPMEVGEYSCVAQLRDQNGTVQSSAVSFECIPSQNPPYPPLGKGENRGFVRVSNKDKRFLEFTEGAPFFPIGQNVAFIGPTQYVDNHKVEEIFKEMSQNGANFVRIWTCCEDWAMAIEARKSAWGRSWAWEPPIALTPGREGYFSDQKCVKIVGEEGASITASPSHPVALRPNTSYLVSGWFKTDVGIRLEVNNLKLGDITTDVQERGWTGWKREFTTSSDEWWLNKVSFRLTENGTAYLRDLSLKEDVGAPELLWEADTNRPTMGFYNPVDCFMLDKVLEAAEQNGIYTQLCLITRDLYMGLLKDESSSDYDKAIHHAKGLLRYVVARWGYSTSVAAWEYFNEINPGLPTDRFYAELGEYFEQIDIYQHLRTTSAWAPCEKNWRHPKLDIADLHWYMRPAWGEIWKDEVAAVMDRAKFLREHASDKPALLGEFGLATDNWALNPYMKQDGELTHFHNVLWASALSGLSGTALLWWWEQLDIQGAYRHYKPLASFLADVPFTKAGLRQVSARVSDQQARVIGLQGKDCAYVWLFNPQATWSKLVIDKVVPADIEGAILEVKGLDSGVYQVQWWHTHEGKVVNQEDILLSEQVCRILIPTFVKDIACKINRRNDR